jgi:ATP-binding cassette subfamily B protein
LAALTAEEPPVHGALLQPGDLVVLDESFAALDPATLEGSMRCALSRAKTLL